jgi:hypothetical protein
MRKLIGLVVLVVLLIVPISVFAGNSQIDRKSFDFGIGAKLGITLWRGELYEGAEERDISIGADKTAISFGYFIINGLSVGGSLSYFNTKVKGITDPLVLVSISPVVKYYLPIGEKILVNVKVLFENNAVEFWSPEDVTSYSAVGGGGAATYLLNYNIGIYGGVDFVHGFNQRYNYDKVNNSSHNKIDIGIGLTIFI